LFLIEATPDDVHDIETAAASAGSIGGLTSHLAVMSRGMGKACVVGTQIQTDEIRREIILKTGHRIGENTPVVLDGTNGVLVFSDSPDLEPKYFTVRHESEVREVVLRAIQNVSADKAVFTDLSVEEQNPIALLKYRLREFGIL
jgi:pyruvate,orthophosphate dikinase